MKSIFFNGKLVPADQPVITTSNRPYRFGDGLFETMKIWKEKIQLEPYHEERLFAGLATIKIEVTPDFTWNTIKNKILHLCKDNSCSSHARVRLSVFRGQENEPFQHIIECWPLDDSFNELNETGFRIDVFPHGLKCADLYSPLKTTNFIAYVMAIEYANEKKLDDCILLNQFNNVADSTISSVFVIKGQMVTTPSLDQGSTNGVMRRHLLTCLQQSGFEVRQAPLSIHDLENADEIFLSNSIRGIRWVKQFRNKTYVYSHTREIYSQFVQTLFH